MANDLLNKTDALELRILLGKRLQELRRSKGYSGQDYFAYDHGFSRSQYSSYERGAVDLRFSNLVRLASAHDITLEELLQDLDK